MLVEEIFLSIATVSPFVAVVAMLIIALYKSETARCIFAGFCGMLVLLLIGLATAEPIVPGNIDLDSRQVVVWDDGSFSTEISFSVEIDGLEVLLPLIVDGELVSEDEAIQHFFDTGEHLGMFASIEECEDYAAELHLRQEAFYHGR